MLKFKSDKHRKGMFANMFGRRKDKRSKVNPASVTNMEIKVLKEKYTPHTQKRSGNIISQSGHFDVVYRDTEKKEEWRESHRVSNTRAELDLGAILEIQEVEEASKKTPKRTIDVMEQEGETVRSEKLGGNHPRERSIAQTTVNYIPPPEEEVLKLALEKKFKKWTKTKKEDDRLTRAELDVLAVIATPKQSREGRNRDVEDRLKKHFFGLRRKSKNKEPTFVEQAKTRQRRIKEMLNLIDQHKNKEYTVSSLSKELKIPLMSTENILLDLFIENKIDIEWKLNKNNVMKRVIKLRRSVTKSDLKHFIGRSALEVSMIGQDATFSFNTGKKLSGKITNFIKGSSEKEPDMYEVTKNGTKTLIPEDKIKGFTVIE